MTKLTQRSVNAFLAAAVPEGKKERRLWDGELRGFGVRQRGKGAATYFVQYRNKHGRSRWLKIGSAAVLAPDEARRRAKLRLAEVLEGLDPAEERSEARNDMTIAGLCDLYLAEGCGAKKASTVAIDRSRIARHVKPLIGHMKLGAVTRTTIERFRNDVAGGKSARDEKTIKRGRSIVRGGKGGATLSIGVQS